MSRALLNLIALLLFLVPVTGTVAQIVQLTHDPLAPLTLSENRTQSSGESSGVTLAVWGGTARDADSGLRNVLVHQFIDGATVRGVAALFTSPEERPFGLVRVLPAGDRFIVVWNDGREEGSGVYYRQIMADGTVVDDRSVRIDSLHAATMEVYGAVETGSAVLGWNVEGDSLSRFLSLDTNGAPIGSTLRMKGRIVGLWDLPRGERGTIIQLENGAGIVIGNGPDSVKRFVAAPLLHTQLVFDADSTIWMIGDTVARHVRRLWDPVEISSITYTSFGGLCDVVLFTRSSNGGYDLHFVRDMDSTISGWGNEKTGIDLSILYTLQYDAAGVLIRESSRRIREIPYRTFFQDGDMLVPRGQRFVIAFRTNSCGGSQTVSFVWSRHYTDRTRGDAELVRYDTISFYPDMRTGELLQDVLPAVCDITTPETIRRRDDDSIVVRTDQRDIVVGYVDAIAPAPVFVQHLALGIRSGRPSIAYSHLRWPTMPLELSSFAITSLDPLMLDTLDPLLIDTLTVHPEAAVDPNYADTSEHAAHARVYSVGSSIVAEVTQARLDYMHWFGSSSDESTRVGVFMSTPTGWSNHPPPLVERYDDPYTNSHEFDLPWIVGTTRNPNSGAMSTLLNHVGWQYVHIGDRGDVIYRIRMPLGIARRLWDGEHPHVGYVMGNVDTVLVILGDSLVTFSMDKRVTSIRFANDLRSPTYHRLFGDRFLRCGYRDTTGLLLQVYDLQATQMYDTLLADIAPTDSILVVAGIGDSAIVLVSGGERGVEARVFNQNLHAAGTTVRVTTMPVAGPLTATLLDDTCFIAWISPNNGATDAFGTTMVMPPVPDGVPAGISGRSESVVTGEEGTTAKSSGIAVALVPNPVRDHVELLVTLDGSTHLDFDVIDVSGRVVLRRLGVACRPGENRLVLDVSALTPGSYTVGVTTRNGRGKGKLIIVR